MGQTSTERLLLQAVKNLEQEYEIREAAMSRRLMGLEEELKAVKWELQKLKDMFEAAKNLFASLQALSNRIRRSV